MKTSFDPSGDHCGQSRLSSLRLLEGQKLYIYGS